MAQEDLVQLMDSYNFSAPIKVEVIIEESDESTDNFSIEDDLFEYHSSNLKSELVLDKRNGLSGIPLKQNETGNHYNYNILPNTNSDRATAPGNKPKNNDDSKKRVTEEKQKCTKKKDSEVNIDPDLNTNIIFTQSSPLHESKPNKSLSINIDNIHCRNHRKRKLENIQPLATNTIISNEIIESDICNTNPKNNNNNLTKSLREVRGDKAKSSIDAKNLDTISQQLLVIIESHNEFKKNYKKNNYDNIGENLHKFMSLESQCFKESYSIINTVFLAKECSKQFIQDFIDKTVKLARADTVRNIECNHRQIKKLFDEMIDWAKRNKTICDENQTNHKKSKDNYNQLKQQLSQPPKPFQYPPFNNYYGHNHQPNQANSSTCIFSTGAPGQEVKISVQSHLINDKYLQDPQLITNKSIKHGPVYSGTNQPNTAVPTSIQSNLIMAQTAQVPQLTKNNLIKHGPLHCGTNQSNAAVPTSIQSNLIKAQTVQVPQLTMNNLIKHRPICSGKNQSNVAVPTSIQSNLINAQTVQVATSKSIRHGPVYSGPNQTVPRPPPDYYNYNRMTGHQNSFYVNDNVNNNNQNYFIDYSTLPMPKSSDYLYSPPSQTVPSYTNNIYHPVRQTPLANLMSMTGGYQLPHQEINLFTKQNATNQQSMQNASDGIDTTRSSVSTDSGFMSPLNIDPVIDSPTSDKSYQPVITHVTSLNPNVSYIDEGQCQVCGIDTKKKCLGCLMNYYCSYECQRSDWKTHVFVCNSSKENDNKAVQ